MTDAQTTQAAQGEVRYDASAAIMLTGQAQRSLANAADMTVDSQDMLTCAGEDLRAVKSLQKQVEEKRTAITVPLNAALKAINDLFRAPKEYLERAETTLKGAMLTYTQEQERLAVIARRIAEEAAQKERDRLAEEQRQQEAAAHAAAQAAAQAQRVADEAIAKGDAQAAAAAQEQVRQQAEAAQAATTAAEATAVTAAVVSMPVAVHAPSKVTGISTSKTMDYEVTDLHALIVHIAAHPDLVTLVMADAVKLRAQVRATGMNTKLPGVRVFEKRGMSARAA